MRFRQNVQQSGAKGYITAFSHYSLSVASCGHGIHKQWVPKTIRSTKTWLNNTSARKIKNQNKKHFFFYTNTKAETFRLTSSPRQPDRFRSWMLRHSLTETKEGLLRCWQSRMLRWMRYMRALGRRLATILSVTLPCKLSLMPLKAHPFRTDFWVRQSNQNTQSLLC